MRICFHFDHWNCEPKCDSVNLHAVHLNIKKNNNIGVLCWVAVFTVSHKHVNSLNIFCYICVEFSPKSQRKSITPIVNEAYKLYFGCKVGDQDESWALLSYCSRSSQYLHGWLTGTHQSMPFTVPVVWRWQKEHLTNCYFCLTKIDGHNSKPKHDDSLPIPKPPQQWTLLEEEPTSTSPEDKPRPSCSSVDPGFPGLTVPNLISQSELDDLMRDLNLSKIQAELLASLLQEWNLLQQSAKVSYT
jgi:hypothetical protein